MMRHLLLSGGPGHDFDATSAALIAGLADAEIDSTTVAEPAEAVTMLRQAEAGTTAPWDLVTVNALRWRMEAERYAGQRDEWAVELTDDDASVLDAYVAGGGGLLALHTAVICFDAHPQWKTLLGAAWNWDRSGHPPVGQVDVSVTDAGTTHPVSAGVEPFSIVDELYGDLDTTNDVVPLLTGSAGDEAHPVFWTREHGRGRVVTDLLGHGVESLTHPRHRDLLARSASWAARSDRLDLARSAGDAPKSPPGGAT